MKDFAARQHLDWTGAPQTFSRRTVFRMLAKIEAGDARALLPRQRQDAGQAKVIVTREFDAAALAAGVSRQQLEKINTKLTRYIRSLIAAGGSSPKTLGFNVDRQINRYAEELGMAASGFTVPDYRFEQEAAYKNVHRQRTDAKAEADARPRISRGLHALCPCDAIICDVHPLDIQVARADGSVAAPRLIAWYDIATHRVFFTVLLCEAGTGVRNEHVIQSFLDMVAAWGLPKALYLDNGTEYNWAAFIGDALKLAAGIQFHIRGDCTGLGRIVRAKPYNAQAKGLIEGFFRIFEGSYLSHLPGYIGGNRLIKKSASLGRPPAPFEGGMEKLAETLQTNLRLYNALPQKGQLRGKSPDETFRRFVEADWTMTAAEEDALRIAFAEEKTRTVTQGRIQYGGQFWTCDELAAYQGKSVIALIPKYERWDCIPLKDERGQMLGYARPVRSYSYFDAEGAKESARLGKLFRDGVKRLERETDRLDVQQEIESNVIRLPSPLRAPVGATLEASDEARPIVAAMRETPEEERARKRREREAREDKERAFYAKQAAALKGPGYD